MSHWREVMCRPWVVLQILDQPLKTKRRICYAEHCTEGYDPTIDLSYVQHNFAWTGLSS